MPKLNDPKITKGKAISYLVELYRNDPKFVEGLDQIRLPYLRAIYDFAMDILEFCKIAKEILPKPDYWTTVNTVLQQKQQELNLPTELRTLLKKVEKSFDKLKLYLIDLDKLAFEWKLRIPSAASVLLLSDIFDFYLVMGMLNEIEIPLESLEYIYPWSPPAPDFVIKISAWSFFLLGREQIAREITEKLLQFEKQLKLAGHHEFPSALKNHANWWFLHYVKQKSYAEIATIQTNPLRREPIVYTRTIGDAVRKFSKFIGLDAKGLR